MAAPITHIVLTEKIFNKFFIDKTKKDFFIGSLFPDIRYLKVIDRDKTHFKNLTIVDLENNDSFSAGLKFHSIVDIVREKFIIANNVYSLCPKSKYITQSLKILEDEIFYQYVKNWDIYKNYFNEILSSEKKFGISEKDLRRWHSLLQRYLKKQPDEQTIRDFALDIGFSEEIASEINKNIVKMRADKKIVDILKNLYKNFGELV